MFVKRVLPYPMLDAFDGPNAQDSCPRRFSTVVPAQALTVMNDKFVLEWSTALAGRVLNDSGLQPDQQIERAYRIALSRPPAARMSNKRSPAFSASRPALIADRLTRNEKVLLPDNLPPGTDPARAAAFVDFCHALLNSNEFMYVN